MRNKQLPPERMFIEPKEEIVKPGVDAEGWTPEERALSVKILDFRADFGPLSQRQVEILERAGEEEALIYYKDLLVRYESTFETERDVMATGDVDGAAKMSKQRNIFHEQIVAFGRKHGITREQIYCDLLSHDASLKQFGLPEFPVISPDYSVYSLSFNTRSLDQVMENIQETGLEAPQSKAHREGLAREQEPRPINIGLTEEYPTYGTLQADEVAVLYGVMQTRNIGNKSIEIRPDDFAARLRRADRMVKDLHSNGFSDARIFAVAARGGHANIITFGVALKGSSLEPGFVHLARNNRKELGIRSVDLKNEPIAEDVKAEEVRIAAECEDWVLDVRSDRSLAERWSSENGDLAFLPEAHDTRSMLAAYHRDKEAIFGKPSKAN